MKNMILLATIGLTTMMNAQVKNPLISVKKKETVVAEAKPVIYQVFTRLFGNKNTTNKPWGTIEQNGVGKFSDFTDTALDEIKKLGVTHIWYTGVPHHATVTDYTKFGIANDDPDVVKGRAGSPYAIKDYYNVDPDLANDPANRLAEFQTLIDKTHKHFMKVIIDIVPNHVARKYGSKNNPKGVVDLGANDDKTVEYQRDNNFYYIPGKPFEVPKSDTYKPLNGEKNKMSDGKFDENPAKWTGNGTREPQPDINDWYETVKLNFGVKPDGSKDFPELPKSYENRDYTSHYKFWQDKEVPDSWKKYRDIALFWLEQGVDGFRYDMAEMVPVEFWSYMNSAIKMKNPDAFLVAEIYNPKEYRNYIYFGKMGYLYDKVSTYDKLKDIIQGKSSPDELISIQAGMKDIDSHMVNFLENHDEQRIASPEFAGSAEKGMPLMVYTTTVSKAPIMIYFGQEVGEPGNENAGFGTQSRTSIFDYVGVPNHQRWMNKGKFDGGKLSNSEKDLRDFYSRLLNFAGKSSALMGEYENIQEYNSKHTSGYNAGLYSYVRYSENEKLAILVNFSWKAASKINFLIPANVITAWKLKDGRYEMTDQLYGEIYTMTVSAGKGEIPLTVKPSESLILKLK